MASKTPTARAGRPYDPEYARAWYLRHRERILTKKREEYTTEARHDKKLREYGITSAELDGLRVRQAEACAICREPLRPTGRGGAQIDHCHATGKVRGLLCRMCNVGLGMYRDDPERLHAAIRYLEQHRPADAPSEDTQ